MKGFRLVSVLRARNIQENQARAELAQARKEAAEAAERARRMDAAIDARPRPEAEHAAAFAATMWARQAMAGELSAAMAIAGQLDGLVDARTGDLTAASTRRRTVEKLAERHADSQRKVEETAAQAEADDLTTSRNRGESTTR